MQCLRCLPACLPATVSSEITREIDTTLSMAPHYYSRLVWLLCAAMAMAVAFHPAPAAATDYRVGDDHGWTLNYTIGWPEGKTFKVGDNLVFKYTKGNYTVMEVDSQTFRDCYRQGNAINEWTSGEDTVKLDKPGRRWFFCGMDDHCEMGLKLVVHVDQAQAAPAPAPVPLPAPAPSPNTTGPPVSPPHAPPTPQETNPSPSSATLSHRKIGEAVARAAVVAAAVVAAVLMV